MKRIYTILFALLPMNVLFAQDMQPSNLIKKTLFNYPNEHVAVLKNPLMYGEGNPYSGGNVQGAIQIVTPLADFMFDVEGTIMRFGPGWQEKIRFHLNAYGWSGGGTVNYTANPIKAFWEKRLPDLQDLPVTLGNLSVNGSPKTTITIGNGNTVWGSYMVIVIDKVYVTNQSAGNYLYDDSKWQVSKVVQLNTTENVSTVFGAAPFPKALVNEAIDGQSLVNASIVPAGQFRAMNGVNVVGAPNASYWNVLSMRHSNPANDYRMEIAGNFFENDIKFRNTNNNSAQGWNTFFHSGNTDYTRVALGLPANPLRSHKAVEWITYPGADANTIEENTSSFTYNYNAPTVGPLAHFGNSGYGLQLNAAYSGSSSLYFRTRNGDGNWGWNNWRKLIYEDNNNMVGIGTESPVAKLDVVGGQAMTGGWNQTAMFRGTYPVTLYGSSAFNKYAGIGYDSGASEGLSFWTNATSADVSSVPAKMVLTNEGNLGLGIRLPQEKLAVNGKIRAREVKVEPITGWPDYVFEDSYSLLTLPELSKFVRENKRLPEVPSAKEVEENGIELGEMNRVLLKKIEELTLHLIEKEEQINAEKMINRNQALQILALEEKFLEFKLMFEKMIIKQKK